MLNGLALSLHVRETSCDRKESRGKKESEGNGSLLKEMVKLLRNREAAKKALK